ncbi:MAG: ribosome small subunit-dependent GTPase A [Elusimicrobia bacterium]|nr:ribosome small subunit-dependent GTPase A [Elusimicrobiota bacterium]
MPPKFLGGDERWLDSEDRSPRPKHSRKAAPRRGFILRPEEGNAVVAEVFPNQSAVRRDGAGERLLCDYRMASLAVGGAARERSPVCVGDRVRVQAGTITGRCERRNQLVRSAPNSRDPLLHVIAANIDCLVVVAAAREPEFSVGIIDRFLVAASAQGIPALLCVNKTDLLGPGDERPWELYPAAGVPVLETSARSGAGAAELRSRLRGQTAAFCGHSGVGKTSLLRRLLGDEACGRVAELSAASGKGRHTTSGAVLLPGPKESNWIDTPGIMNFALVGVGRAGLLAHFKELASAAALCGPGCAHEAEPACVLRRLPRYHSYRQILGSLG